MGMVRCKASNGDIAVYSFSALGRVILSRIKDAQFSQAKEEQSIESYFV